MKKYFLFFAIALMSVSLICFNAFASAKNDPVIVLEAEDGYLDGPASIWGQKVGNIGMCGGSVEGTITYYDLDLPENGTYTMVIHYYSGSDDRNFIFTVDGVEKKLECPSTGSFDIVGTILMDIDLNKGSTLKIGTDWYGPDLDKIEIYEQDSFEFVDRIYSDQNFKTESFNNDYIKFDVNNGVYTVGSLKNGENVDYIVNAHSEFIINSEIISSDDFKEHTLKNVTSINSNEKQITFEHKNHPTFDGILISDFIYNLKENYLTIKVTIKAESEISVNYISALSVYSDSLKIDNSVFLKIPFDNDMWGEPTFIDQYSLGHTTTSYEVAALIGKDEGASSIVCGSLSHDVWKTGIDINSEDGSIKGFNLYAGAADSGTRDKFSHGYITSTEITSPVMFLSIGEDWREELDLFGSANIKIQAPLESSTDVPFGFNSWGSLGTGVSYGDMIAVSNYIKEFLSESWGEDGAPVYVNIDSFWDYIHKNGTGTNMTLDEALKAFVKTCHDNGQKAGIYYTPFACWLETEEDMVNTFMEGSDYTFYDAALRSPSGMSIYGKLNGGYALDPTHPGTIARIEKQFNYFIDLGFEYIKLDFTTHGALEGDHYLDEVTTGIQAYNYGMSKINEICKGKMFVNLSISPVFPYQYADGRRISCDAFASIDNTKHVLSYVDACFWQRKLYSFPDPDHLVVTGVSENVARARVTSGVISGTSFIIGDNLSAIRKGSEDHKRILKMYGNKDIIAVAKLGAMFKPVSIFRDDGVQMYAHSEDGCTYLAVFNFGEYAECEYAVAASDLELVKELWSGKEFAVTEGKLTFSIGANDAVIFKIQSKTQPTPTLDESATNTPDNTDAEHDKTGTASPENTTTVVICIALAIVVFGAAAALIIIKKK